jgi:hypothetical protein
VFVHGLNPLGSKNHAYSTWTGIDGTCWPKDLLHEKIPWARVIIVGYNSSIAFDAGTGTIRTHAITILDRLRSERKKDVRLENSFKG